MRFVGFASPDILLSYAFRRSSFGMPPLDRFCRWSSLFRLVTEVSFDTSSSLLLFTTLLIFTSPFSARRISGQSYISRAWSLCQIYLRTAIHPRLIVGLSP